MGRVGAAVPSAERWMMPGAARDPGEGDGAHRSWGSGAMGRGGSGHCMTSPGNFGRAREGTVGRTCPWTCSCRSQEPPGPAGGGTSPGRGPTLAEPLAEPSAALAER